MIGNDLIEYIKQRPQLLSVDIKFTIMSLINDRLINPSSLIDAQYAIKDEECKRYRLHWQEANVAANMLMTGNKEQKEYGRLSATRLYPNSHFAFQQGWKAACKFLERVHEVEEICCQCGKLLYDGDNYFLYDEIGCFCEKCMNKIEKGSKNE